VGIRLRPLYADGSALLHINEARFRVLCRQISNLVLQNFDHFNLDSRNLERFEMTRKLSDDGNCETEGYQNGCDIRNENLITPIVGKSDQRQS